MARVRPRAAIEWPFGGSLEEITQRAVLLISFADGQEEAGFVVGARRMRAVARDVIELAARVHSYEDTQRHAPPVALPLTGGDDDGAEEVDF
jgi:hypothetical protein